MNTTEWLRDDEQSVRQFVYQSVFVIGKLINLMPRDYLI
jgi:hypothetical protein